MRYAATEEAQQLAAEIHDGIGQELAGISLLLTAVRWLPRAQHPEVQQPLNNIADLLVRAMVNCRKISEGFGGFLVRQQGLTAALLHFASQFDDEGTRIEFYGRDIPVHWLDETTAHYLFAIGREAIFNAVRHSRANKIRVTCDHADDAIHLSVEDDGVGLAELSMEGRGIGRSIMEFRARSIGAELRYTAVTGGGLRMECRLHCSDIERGDAPESSSFAP